VKLHTLVLVVALLTVFVSVIALSLRAPSLRVRIVDSFRQDGALWVNLEVTSSVDAVVCDVQVSDPAVQVVGSDGYEFGLRSGEPRIVSAVWKPWKLTDPVDKRVRVSMAARMLEREELLSRYEVEFSMTGESQD
jgi:hypothetical protein